MGKPAMPLSKVRGNMAGLFTCNCVSGRIFGFYYQRSRVRPNFVLRRSEKGGRKDRLSAKSARKHAWSASGPAENGDGAPVLRPAGNVVAHGDRTFLAVGDRADACRRNAPGDQEVAGRRRTAGAEREVVFAGAAFVRMALDGDRIGTVLGQPLRLARKRRLRIGPDD